MLFRVPFDHCLRALLVRYEIYIVQKRLDNRGFTLNFCTPHAIPPWRAIDSAKILRPFKVHVYPLGEGGSGDRSSTGDRTFFVRDVLVFSRGVRKSPPQSHKQRRTELWCNLQKLVQQFLKTRVHLAASLPFIRWTIRQLRWRFNKSQTCARPSLAIINSLHRPENCNHLRPRLLAACISPRFRLMPRAARPQLC